MKWAVIVIGAAIGAVILTAFTLLLFNLVH
jgi:hypothetical protein